MPRNFSGGGRRGGGGRGGRGGGRGGGGSRGGFGGGRGGGGGGSGRNGKKNYKRKNAIDVFNKKKPKSKPLPGTEDYKIQKFKHIQRNQLAEQSLKERKELEIKHQTQQKKYQNNGLNGSSDDDENDDDEKIETTTALERLIKLLPKSNEILEKKKLKQFSAIESSDSEDENEDNDDNSDDDEEDDDDGDGDGSSDSDDAFLVDDNLEEKEFIPLKPKKKVASVKQDKVVENDSDDSSDVDDDEDIEDEHLSEEESEDEDKSAGEEVEEEEDAEEVEEEEEEEIDAELDEIETETKDMFSIHLDNEIRPELLEYLNKEYSCEEQTLNWPALGELYVEIPKVPEITHENIKKKPKLLLDSDVKYATEGKLPTKINYKTDNLSGHFIKTQIQSNILEANRNNLVNNDKPELPLNDLQSEIFSIMNNYQDFYYPNRTLENGEQIRFAYCLHALNHILKSRTKILHHNAKLSKQAPTIMPESYADQGMVRPKILIVVPFRESALRTVKCLISLIFPEGGTKIMNYNRFIEEFSGETLHFPKHNPKPKDYEQTFAGNSDDSFRLGICLTRKCMKLYTDFYSSDILIVSPVGLRMIIGAAGDKDRDYDFLTSIEMLILDQSDLFLAQNWENIIHIMDHLHLQPKSVRKMDLSRVRSWCIHGWSRFYRQTLMFSSHELPEFPSLFINRFKNYRGRIRVVIPVVHGTIRDVDVQVPQVFHRVEVSTLLASVKERFNYFIKTILPQFKGASKAHCLVFIPSYFEYVRLRNYFKKESVDFVQICEYTEDGKIARARDMFFHSGAHFMLYTERSHFFRRTRIKGIRHLIMYQPPNWPNFYSELVNLMDETYQNPRDGGKGSISVTVLYTKYDLLQIQGIIGTDRAQKLSESDKTVHSFSTGD